MGLPIKKNRVKADLSNYSILLNGIGGVGKTTLFFNVCEKLYGEDGGLMINCGEEPQPTHIPNANYLQADTFEDIIKNEDYTGIYEQFKSEYPEMFKDKNIEKRIAVYQFNYLIGQAIKCKDDKWINQLLNDFNK